MKTYIIFLEIDGVLNNYNLKYFNNDKQIDNYCLNWLIEAISQLSPKQKVKIVINSSWKRNIELEDFIKFIKKHTHQYQALKEIIFKEAWKTPDVCLDNNNASKYDEVFQWLINNKPKYNIDSKYLIIDSIIDDYIEKQPVLQVNPLVGLTYLEKELIIAYFQQQLKTTLEKLNTNIFNILNVYDNHGTFLEKFCS